MSIVVGSILEGVVTGITSFGAFVGLADGQTGLVHISEVAEAYVKDVNEFLRIGDKVKVKVVAVDAKGKIGLSIKRAKVTASYDRRKKSVSFEDRLSKFLKDSDERQQDLKKIIDSKRGGRGAAKRASVVLTNKK
jgi:S1 RNA binding domain protein